MKICKLIIFLAGILLASFPEELPEDHQLIIAANSGNQAFIKSKMEGDDVDFVSSGFFCLVMGIEGGHLHVVEQLAKCTSIDVTKYQDMALRRACSVGHSDIIRFLAAHPAVDMSGLFARLLVKNKSCYNIIIRFGMLLNACKNGHLNLFDSINLTGLEPEIMQMLFEAACWSGQSEVASKLLASSSGTLQMGRALLYSAIYSQESVVKSLLYGMDVGEGYLILLSPSDSLFDEMVFWSNRNQNDPAMLALLLGWRYFNFFAGTIEDLPRDVIGEIICKVLYLSLKR